MLQESRDTIRAAPPAGAVMDRNPAITPIRKAKTQTDMVLVQAL